MYENFTRKGYGRIYVKNESDIQKVKDIMREVDEGEFDGYFPSKLITTFDKYPQLEYTGKFEDMDMHKVSTICFKKGIEILVIDNGMCDYLRDPIK